MIRVKIRAVVKVASFRVSSIGLGKLCTEEGGRFSHLSELRYFPLDFIFS